MNRRREYNEGRTSDGGVSGPEEHCEHSEGYGCSTLRERDVALNPGERNL